MKRSLLFLLALAVCGAVAAQQVQPPQQITRYEDSPNLPLQKIGPNDLVGVAVYDAPELTRTVRVGADGLIHLPMLKERIDAKGLYPGDLEKAISAALVKEGILVDPVVTVSVVEYRSRPISVAGEVRLPLTFQAEGRVTLLDALARAQGLTENAGADILVSSRTTDSSAPAVVRRIPVATLMNGADPALNLELQGGEEIRVPAAGKVFVVGNVKKPGSFIIKDGGSTSLMKVVAMAEGTLPYCDNTAFIYRAESGSSGKTQIPVQFKKIMDRKAPDVTVMADDVVYIPENSGRRVRSDTLKETAMVGGGIVAALIMAMMR